jgi:hypothetical protein
MNRQQLLDYDVEQKNKNLRQRCVCERRITKTVPTPISLNAMNQTLR